MEGHQKFLWGEGALKVKFFEAKYEAKLKFLRGRGGGAKQENLLWEEYGYFLELHILSPLSGIDLHYIMLAVHGSDK